MGQTLSRLRAPQKPINEKTLYDFVKTTFWGITPYLKNGGGWLPSDMPLMYSVIPSMRAVKGLEPLTMAEVKHYFTCLKHHPTKVAFHTINDLPPNPALSCQLHCHTCNIHLMTQSSHDFFYCTKLHFNMCKRCIESFKACVCDLPFDTHVIMRNLIYRDLVCNMCTKPILTQTVTTITPRYLPDTVRIPIPSNDDDALFCQNCMFYYEINDKLRGGTFKEVLNPYIAYFKQMHIGSILDWVPILKDCHGSMVLLNLNAQSQFFRQVALMKITANNHLFHFMTLPGRHLVDVMVTLELYFTQNKKRWSLPNLETSPIKKLFYNENV